MKGPTSPKRHLYSWPLSADSTYVKIRVGPDIRQCRIIRPDFSFCRISSQIIRPDFSFCRIIRPDPAGTGHPASGKKYQIRPNPSLYVYLSVYLSIYLSIYMINTFYLFVTVETCIGRIDEYWIVLSRDPGYILSWK